MNAASPELVVANRERRWYQFSLRTMFAIMVLASVSASTAAVLGFVLGVFLFTFAGGLLVLGWAVWQRRSFTAAVGIALAALALVLPVVLQGPRWIGRRAFPLVVNVLDRETGQGIPGASVRLDAQHGRGPSFIGTTANDGSVAMTPTFTIVGSDDLFRKSGAIYLWEHSLSVRAGGYEPTVKPLSFYTGEIRDLYGGPIPPITVGLKRQVGSADEFRSGMGGALDAVPASTKQ